jgi:hypothetical protein
MSARQSEAVSKALRDVARGMTPYAAAKKHKIAFTTIYRALKRVNQRPKVVADSQDSLVRLQVANAGILDALTGEDIPLTPIEPAAATPEIPPDAPPPSAI